MDVDWQPIETAPKNQAVIVSSGDRTGEACHICYDDLQGWYWADDRGVMDLTPTHWTPLPAPAGKHNT